MTVITTCSPKNFDLVRQRGADLAFDYHSSSVVADIKRAAGDQLKKVMDCISTPESGQLCGAVFGQGADGHYVCVNQVASIGRSDVKRSLRWAYTALGRPVRVNGREYPATPEDLATSKVFLESMMLPLLENRGLKIHPLRVRAGGLEAALKGLDELRNGKVSAVKLIYEMKI